MTVPFLKKVIPLRIVLIFLGAMGILIIVLLFSYNWVLQIGHERQCNRLYAETAKIEECVDHRRRGILLEHKEQQELLQQN